MNIWMNLYMPSDGYMHNAFMTPMHTHLLTLLNPITKSITQSIIKHEITFNTSTDYVMYAV